MRLVVAGTPAVALPSLEALAGSRHEVVAVLTRPDGRAGRGRRPARSPVAAWADARELPVLQPSRPGDADFLTALRELAPDCCPVIAYGALLPQQALAVPRFGWVNLHFSVLPAWRGAAPVQRALMAGDDVTGATTFRIEAGLDTGPVFGTLTEAVRPRDTAGDLLDRLAAAGAPLLLATLDGIEDGVLEARPQSLDGVSLAPKVSVAEAMVEWGLPAESIDRRIRGCTPDPGAWTTWRGERLTVESALPVSDPVGGVSNAGAESPGTLRVTRMQVFVATGQDELELLRVRPSGRSTMPAIDWARGARPQPGERLT